MLDLQVVRDEADDRPRSPTSSSIFQRPESPSERRCVSLMKSSRKPIAPQASVANSTVSPCSVKCVTGRNATVAANRIMQAAHRRRPLLGDVMLRPLLADVLPELVRAQELDEARADQDRHDQRDERGDQDSGHGAATPASAVRDDLEPDRAGALHEHDVARPDELARERRRLRGARRPIRRGS